MLYPLKLALRGIEWVELAFPEVNVHVHVNVNVPEEVWSHALKAKFRKPGTNPCKQKLSGAIFVRGEVAKSVELQSYAVDIQFFIIKHTTRDRSPGQIGYVHEHVHPEILDSSLKRWVMPHRQSFGTHSIPR